MKDFIPGNFSNYGDLITTSSSYTVKERDDLFILLPKELKVNSLLELGCADGNNLIFFKNKFNLKKKDVVGVDNCNSNITKEIRDFQFIHESAEKFIEKNKRQYDLVIFSDVIEHIYNPWKILSKTKQVLTKNGLALLSIPNFQNLNYIKTIFNGNFYYKRTGLFDETHIRFFSLNTIKSYLKDLGFKIIKTGWREDKSLKTLKEKLLNELDNKEYVNLEIENFKIKILKLDIENYFNQQILVCFSNA